MGGGADYLYYGQTTLTGVHTHDTLQLTQHEQEYLHVVSPQERREYDYYLDTLVRDTDVMKTKLHKARIEGEKQGRAEGRKESIIHSYS